jgi:hypothetical protein
MAQPRPQPRSLVSELAAVTGLIAPDFESATHFLGAMCHQNRAQVDEYIASKHAEMQAKNDPDFYRSPANHVPVNMGNAQHATSLALVRCCFFCPQTSQVLYVAQEEAHGQLALGHFVWRCARGDLKVHIDDLARRGDNILCVYLGSKANGSEFPQWSTEEVISGWANRGFGNCTASLNAVLYGAMGAFPNGAEQRCLDYLLKWLAIGLPHLTIVKANKVPCGFNGAVQSKGVPAPTLAALSSAFMHLSIGDGPPCWPSFEERQTIYDNLHPPSSRKRKKASTRPSRTIIGSAAIACDVCSAMVLHGNHGGNRDFWDGGHCPGCPASQRMLAQANVYVAK